MRGTASLTSVIFFKKKKKHPSSAVRLANKHHPYWGCKGEKKENSKFHGQQISRFKYEMCINGNTHETLLDYCYLSSVLGEHQRGIRRKTSGQTTARLVSLSEHQGLLQNWVNRLPFNTRMLKTYLAANSMPLLKKTRAGGGRFQRQ